MYNLACMQTNFCFTRIKPKLRERMSTPLSDANSLLCGLKGLKTICVLVSQNYHSFWVWGGQEGLGGLNLCCSLLSSMIFLLLPF